MPKYRQVCATALVSTVAAILAACGSRDGATDMGADREDPRALVERLNAEARELGAEVAAAAWVQATYITPDTQLLNARATERMLAWFSAAAGQAAAYDGQALEPDVARALKQVKLGVAAPAPRDPDRRAELARLASKLEAMYGEAKGCREENGKEVCRTVEDLSDILGESRDYEKVTNAWVDWHAISRPMKQDYVRFVELANEGARELGFADLGAMWRSGYDMEPDAFVAEVDRLWGQVKPLYDELHCYTRARLAKKYGEDKVPAGQPIPAQLLGNMWAQQWNRIYEDLLQPFPAVASPSADAALKAQKWDAVRMTRSAEEFYTSLGFPKLPDSFWERSMLTRPRDREVVCHASAWQMDGGEDVRIKQCIVPTEEELQTIYHELGHVYYDLAYKDQPFLFQGGAHDGFHEAIGDTVVLSMTPEYMRRVGLRRDARASREATLNEQMKLAADRIAFLPFGLLVDQWRWKVFSGEVTPENYNAAWWELRERYQGVRAPVPRTEEDFDPGAKFHIPGNTPYTRYFLAFILQFQFHEALCKAAGHTGPLHECSVYGSKEAGERFQAMLREGASKPWQETLEKLTGTREMDGRAIVNYFAPLMEYLKEANAGQQCGWSG
jgi:peptidyl-dipeptidase A